MIYLFAPQSFPEKFRLCPTGLFCPHRSDLGAEIKTCSKSLSEFQGLNGALNLQSKSGTLFTASQ